MLEIGSEVPHPQWGRGTVLFDKPHCIGIRFLEHGQVNFTQEEWTAQHSPPERFRGILSMGGSGISDLEYSLEQAIENGEISEKEALRFLREEAHPFELKRYSGASKTINEAYTQYKAGLLHEDTFLHTLLARITTILKSLSTYDIMFSKLEDITSSAAMKVWSSLDKYEPSRGSFARFVTMIVQSEISDYLLREGGSGYECPSCPVIYTSLNGFKAHLRRVHPDVKALIKKSPAPRLTDLESASTLHTSESSPEAAAVFADRILKFKAKLDATNLAIFQMLSDGLTQEEIALSLNISQPAVNKRIRYLREVIKTEF